MVEAGPAQKLRYYMLPLTILVMVGGLTWQGITIAITRKGDGLTQAARGVWNTALWGVIGVAGMHLALKAGDSYSAWLLNETILDGAEKPNETMSGWLGALMMPAASVAPLVMIIVGIVVILVAITQTIMMVFREGAVVILAGLLQFAAAGTITRATSPWFQKTAGWALALAMYKPAAASVYATAFLLMQGSGRDWVMGLGMFAMSVVALPALMKFFTIFTGQVANSGGGGLSMLGPSAAGGRNAGSALPSIGGNSASEHARFMDSQGPGSNPAGKAAPTGALPPGSPGSAATASTSGTTAGAAGGATGTCQVQRDS